MLSSRLFCVSLGGCFDPQLAWPAWMQHKLFTVASISTVNLEIGGVGCVSNAWTVGLLLPLVGTVLIAGAAGCAALYHVANHGSGDNVQSKLAATLQHFRKYPLTIRRWLWNVSSCKLTLAFLAFIYVAAVQTALDVFK